MHFLALVSLEILVLSISYHNVERTTSECKISGTR